ncbi:MAG TPA: helix-turn-helix domain-containing protein [Stenomitos sp.]
MPTPKESTADLILHPVRMRVLQLLGTGRHYTAQQLAEALPDVPSATLYRHLNKLLSGNLLEVVSQRQVRGAQEKTYALRGGSASVDPQELASASREDHMRYFTTFLASLMADFERYLQGESFDLVQDQVGYRTLPLNLSKAEFLQFAQALQEAVRPFIGLPDSPERTIRHFSTVVIPSPAASNPQEA